VVKPGTGRYLEERKELGRKWKGNIYWEAEKSGDICSISQYKMIIPVFLLNY
jgi:hypothetical protein